MDAGAQLKYGLIKGAGVPGVPTLVAATEVITAASGKFVTLGASGATITTATDAEILGHLESAAGTIATGGEQRTCCLDLSAVYRIPVDSGTFAITMIGKTCDLAVTSDVQGADLTASDRDVVKIVGGDAVNNAWVDVVVNPAKVAVTGVV